MFIRTCTVFCVQIIVDWGSWGGGVVPKCLCVCVCVCVHLLRHVRFFATPWTIVHQGPLSMEFSRQEYWSGLPCPLPGDLPDPGIELSFLASPALAGGFFMTSAIYKALQS